MPETTEHKFTLRLNPALMRSIQNCANQDGGMQIASWIRQALSRATQESISRAAVRNAYARQKIIGKPIKTKRRA